MRETPPWHRSTRQPRAAVKFEFYERPDSENMILAALAMEKYHWLRPHLELVPLKARSVLWEPGQAIEFVYFPTSGVVSFISVMRDGVTVGVGMTGREGFIGTPVILGARESPALRAIVQMDGRFFRIGSHLLWQILPQTPQLEQMLRHYVHAYATQVAQSAACNCLHQVPERLARWLAMTRDRTESDLLPITQEFLAQMLGCRRSSVTSAIGGLQKAGVIRPGHGQVRILDRKQLEKQACECYGIIKNAFRSDLDRRTHGSS